MDSDLHAMVARALLASGLTVVEMREDSAVVRLPGGEQHTIGLSNLARTLALTPTPDRPKVLERYVLGWLDQARRAQREEEATLDRARLFPRLLSPEDPGLRAGAMWSERLAEGALVYALALDEPDAIRFVSVLDLPRWRLGLAEARRLAKENLERSSRQLTEALRARPDPWAPFELSTGDGWDASRLLVVHALVPEGRGVLCVVPSRDLLLAVPVRDPAHFPAARAEALARRAWAARAVRELPYPLSPELFWCSPELLERVPVRRDAAGALLAQPSDRVLALATGQEA